MFGNVKYVRGGAPQQHNMKVVGNATSKVINRFLVEVVGDRNSFKGE